MQEMIPKKLEVMQEALEKAGKRVLFDSNHCFIKGFGWELVKHVPHDQIAVLFLRRDPDANAKGLLRIHDVPGLNALARDWYLQPGQVENRTEPREGANKLELCRWYVDETFVRGEEFRRKYPDILTVDVTLNELNDLATVERVFRDFGLEPLRTLSEAVGKRQNARGVYPPLDLELALRPVRFRDPAELSGEEAMRVRQEIGEYLMTLPEVRHTQPDNTLIPGGMMLLMGGVVKTLMKPGFLLRVEEKFNIDILYTELEGGLVKEVTWRLREGLAWPFLPFDRIFLTDPSGSPGLDPPSPLGDYGCSVNTQWSMVRMFISIIGYYLMDVLWRPRSTRIALLAVLLALAAYFFLL
eukprot:TRINITY_DN3850_c0_g1_i2.p1 TRINITY_DN3850_c0_g1~~TRINITY_DN3850_c0_g1_i2.p1  ORF type:complete len:355 (+),score=137.62 TRINITY_DN3850_c0_g1_i2:512-1576(+)